MEYMREMEFPGKRWPAQSSEKTRVRVRTLKEEREQCFILSIIYLIRQACNKPIAYINP